MRHKKFLLDLELVSEIHTLSNVPGRLRLLQTISKIHLLVQAIYAKQLLRFSGIDQ